jgi:hypothetical protein
VKSDEWGRPKKGDISNEPSAESLAPEALAVRRLHQMEIFINLRGRKLRPLKAKAPIPQMDAYARTWRKLKARSLKLLARYLP